MTAAEQKAERERQAAEDEAVRRTARIQIEESEARENARLWANTGSLSNNQFRNLVKTTCGFDPGI